LRRMLPISTIIGTATRRSGLLPTDASGSAKLRIPNITLLLCFQLWAVLPYCNFSLGTKVSTRRCVRRTTSAVKLLLIPPIDRLIARCFKSSTHIADVQPGNYRREGPSPRPVPASPASRASLNPSPACGERDGPTKGKGEERADVCDPSETYF